MAYDDTSMVGDEICDYYYDIENNYMNPPSPTGYFIYKIVGGCFDRINELISEFRMDYSILDCHVGEVEIVEALPDEAEMDTTHTYYVTEYREGIGFKKYTYNGEEWVMEEVTGDVLNRLDIFWGRPYRLLRPHLSYQTGEGTLIRALSDREYKVYLYLKKHQLLTRKDLIVAFTNAFGGAEIIENILDTIHTVDHCRYDNPPYSNEDLKAYDPDDKDITTDQLRDQEDVYLVYNKLQKGIISIIIPDEGWDERFLLFLEDFISIKGNIKIIQQ